MPAVHLGRALAALTLFMSIHTSAAAAAASSAPDAPARSAAIRHVALDLTLELERQRVTGRATLHFEALRPTLEVMLHAVDLDVRTVRRVGHREPLVHKAGPAGRDLIVALDRELPAGTRFVLQVDYASRGVNRRDPAALGGSTGRGLRFLGPKPSDRRERVEVWSSGDAHTARHWFPGHDDDAAPLRTSEIRIAVPRGLTALAGGRRVSDTRLPDGRRRLHWRSDLPHANHRTLLVVGRFERHDEVLRAGTVERRFGNYGPAGEGHGVRPSVSRLGLMVTSFERLLKAALPSPVYAQVFVQDLPWGQAAPGLAVQTENMIDDAGTHDDFQYLWLGLQAETLAQQWFGIALAAAHPGESWLERGLAHHLAMRVNEQINGRDEALLWYLRADQQTALGDWAAGVREPVALPAADASPAFAGGNTPYFRAGAVLHMLRHRLGDAAWDAALAGFYARHRGTRVTALDLQRAAERASGQKLDTFFAQWVHGIGHPVFEIDERWDAAAGRLELGVRQVQPELPAGSRPGARWFEGPVDIAIDHRIERVWIAAQAENRFSFAAPQAPQRVVFDHEGAWLKELRHSKSVPALLQQLLAPQDTPGRQWALEQGVGRVLPPAEAGASGQSTERAEVLRALLALAESDAPWRLRFNALSQMRRLVVPGLAQAGAAMSSAPNAAQAARLEPALVAALQALAARERGWVCAAAIRLIGDTRDPAYGPWLAGWLRHPSDRVIAAAALALGKGGSPLAFDALAALPAHPSWKNQSLIAALFAFKELGDKRAVPMALRALADVDSARWVLATPVWDFPLTAADALAALGAGPAGYEIVEPRLRHALAADDVHAVFSQVQLLAALGDARGRGALASVRQRYAAEPATLEALKPHEASLEHSIAAAAPNTLPR